MGCPGSGEMNAITQAMLDESRGAFAKANPGRDPLTPPAEALYDPSKEHDSCGVGFVADMKNRKSHDILEKGLQILINPPPRGAGGRRPPAGRRLRRVAQTPARFFCARMRQAGFRAAGAGPLRDRP